MAGLTVLYDANVLFPAPLRDLLVELALTGLFRARWTARIHNEWIRNVLEDRPDLDLARLQRVRELMDRAVPDCLIQDYEPLVASLHLPDPADRHVLAAAIVGRAQAIVTFNLRDFPEPLLRNYDVEARHPDEFLAQLISLDRDSVLAAVRTVRGRLRNPPRSVAEYLERLETKGLKATVTELRRFASLL